MPEVQSPFYALITCEHASRAVPRRWRALFAGQKKVLASHRGWDPGTPELGRRLAERLGAPLLTGRATRLLIDLNRSAGHPSRFSMFTRSLSRSERDEIERVFWKPHWQQYRDLIEASPSRVTHIACHGFTPVWNGQERDFDLGLLYDPARTLERLFCRRLAEEIAVRRPGLRIRMNAPYRGTANGLGQHHRRILPAAQLVTIELEVSQALINRGDWAAIQDDLVAAVEAALST